MKNKVLNNNYCSFSPFFFTGFVFFHDLPLSPLLLILFQPFLTSLLWLLLLPRSEKPSQTKESVGFLTELYCYRFSEGDRYCVVSLPPPQGCFFLAHGFSPLMLFCLCLFLIDLDYICYMP